ncbi:MAG: J domain-containing protein [Pseudomonadota bacterium]
MRKCQKAFELLDVSPSDDMTTIRMAWRAKVRALHPDQAQDKSWANARLAEVNAAFDALQGHVPLRPEGKPQTTQRRTRAETRAKAGKPSATAAPPKPTETHAQAPNAKPTLNVRKDAALDALRRQAEMGYARARQSVKAA